MKIEILLKNKSKASMTTKVGVHDDYMTPTYAWDWIRPYIPADKKIWEAFYGNGESGQYLASLGLDVIHENIDFFESDLGDVIVSNPPFSKKREIFTRLRELDKPFIMICPSSMLNTQYIRKLFGDADSPLQIAIPPKRIDFTKIVDGEVVKQKYRCNFDCFYYCYKIGLPRDIIFLPLNTTTD